MISLSATCRRRVRSRQLPLGFASSALARAHNSEARSLAQAARCSSIVFFHFCSIHTKRPANTWPFKAHQAASLPLAARSGMTPICLALIWLESMALETM